MDIRSLNTFIHVAELGSFSRAGERLGYSQPTISVQIKQLEQELGIQLFDRIGRTVRLTDDGHKALAYAQKICRISHQMSRNALGREDAHTIIRLATADSLCAPLISMAYADLRKNYPNISLKLTTAGTTELFRLLDHNEVDLVCTLDSRIYNTNYVIAGEEKIGVHFVAAKDHPLAEKEIITREDVLSHDFLLTERGMSYRRLLDEWLARESMEISPVLETGSADIICKMVESGLGVSFLPDYVTEDAVRRGSMLRLNAHDFHPELWKQLLYHRDKWISDPIQVVIDHLSGVHLNPEKQREI